MLAHRQTRSGLIRAGRDGRHVLGPDLGDGLELLLECLGAVEFEHHAPKALAHDDGRV